MKSLYRRYRNDLWAVLALLALSIVFFWPVLGGGLILLPVDNLYQYLPWQAQAPAQGVVYPHNALASDLILENYPWKLLITEALQDRQLPLWNPNLFAGVPFLAAGQHSALYPLSLLHYIFPIPESFGLFAALTLFLASLNMYVLLRVLGAPPLGGLIAGVTYAFSLFFVASVIFPMVISAAAWLPLLLAVIELLSQGKQGRAVPLIIAGAVVVGLQFMAGHVEIAYYNMMVLGFYTLARCVSLWRPGRAWRPAAKLLIQTALIVGLGVGLAAVQIVPLFELVSQNFREGSASYEDVVGWAYPLRQIITFFVPDFYGNPAIHSYVDIVDHAVKQISVVDPATQKTSYSVFWGIKNYVEAASYAGVLPLLLAAVAVIRRLRRSGAFAVLIVLSLLFAFGTPLYALLFYGLPGYSQLHSAFRWVYPFTLSVAVLAGMATTRRHDEAGLSEPPSGAGERLIGLMGAVALIAGALGLLALVVVVVQPAPFLALSERFLAASSMARSAFGDAQLFLSYQARNLVLFFLFLCGAGAIVLALRRGWRYWPVAAVAWIVADLFIIGSAFYPRADPALLKTTPPAIAFLQEDGEVYRIATLDKPDEKLLLANAPMTYGIQDIRGYDSIIPRRYAEYMNLIETQGELLYNRIAPFYWAGSLDSALVDLLNVKYVATTQELDNPTFTLVYDGEVKIYRNEEYLPRAFVVDEARVIEDEAALREAMKSLDPRREVLLEQAPVEETAADGATPAAPGGESQATITSYKPNRVELAVSMAQPGYLVLSDSYFPGWIAEVRPAGDPEVDAQTPAVLRADYNFRAIPLQAGDYTVVFRYSPLSLRVGLLVSVLSFVLVMLLAATMVWGRLYRDDQTESVTVRRVAKNSVLPMAANLIGRVIDFGFAIIVVRTLGPAGQGRLALAIAIIGFVDIIVNFGLNVLLTREVARDRSRANYYLSNTTILRLLIWLCSLPFIALLIVVLQLPFETMWAVILFTIALVPSNMAAGVGSVFNAYEKMEYPAAVTVITTVLRVALGSAVLLIGWGVIGLAGASIVVNMGTLLILFYPLYTRFFHPHYEFDRRGAGRMLVESYPLMINHLLATVFFRIDSVLMRPLVGAERADVALGYYSTAYKFIDGLNIIPSYFTMAIFPLMSRYAQEAGDALKRSYILSVRMLVLVALPLSVGTMLLADRIIMISFGPKMMPGSAQALAILIWFLPFSFINSVTQYALIAVNQQHFLTRAFLIGAAFNVVANLILIPRYSFLGAALTTVLSEIVLFLPFYYSVRKHITKLPFAQIFVRPLFASAIMGGMIWLLREQSLLIIAPVAVLVYTALILVLGTLTKEDREILLRLRR